MRHARQSALLVTLCVLALARSATATFHEISISEIGAGFGNDPAIQFVELRLDAGGQTNLVNTRLTVFDAQGNESVLVLANHAVTNGTAGANILFATDAFRSATGITPDFAMAASIVSPTGMVCWGAPGIVPPAPESWDANKPNNYVDCIAYGGFAAATRLASGTPSTLPPGDGTQSLTRTKGSGATGSNDVDFGLATPNVCNNAGACTDIGGLGGAVCGDADGSGSVTVTDGVQTLRAAAGLESPCTLTRCDVNGSATITVTDGVQVLRDAAGLPTTPACPD